MPLNDVASSGVGVYPENGTKHKAQGMAKPDASAGSNSGSGSGLSLFSLQGQKWQQVFDLDKVIKQLRTAEKTYLRGGKNSSAGGDQQAKVQVQRLQSADMAYYDLVPKLASRDIVLCSSCSGCYTKAGFQHHIALQHPSVWEATSSKGNLDGVDAQIVNHTAAQIAFPIKDSIPFVQNLNFNSKVPSLYSLQAIHMGQWEAEVNLHILNLAKLSTGDELLDMLV